MDELPHIHEKSSTWYYIWPAILDIALQQQIKRRHRRPIPWARSRKKTFFCLFLLVMQLFLKPQICKIIARNNRSNFFILIVGLNVSSTFPAKGSRHWRNNSGIPDECATSIVGLASILNNVTPDQTPNREKTNREKKRGSSPRSGQALLPTFYMLNPVVVFVCAFLCSTGTNKKYFFDA